MSIPANELPNMVFRRIEKDNIGEFSIDNQMLTLLINLDGKKTVGDILTATGSSLAEIRGTLSKLLKIGLIEPAENAIPVLQHEFIRYLKLQLSQIVGPIADILIEDAAAILGYDPLKVPIHRAAEWVDLLSREISDEKKRIIFTKNMIDRINHPSQR